MIKTGINDLELFKKLINTLSFVMDEVILELKGRDVNVKFMDPSRIMLATITLKDILEKEVETKLYVETDNLKKVLNQFKHKDVVDLEIDNELITFVFRRGKEWFTYTQLSTIDNEDVSRGPLDSIDYPCEFELKKSKLSDIINKSLGDIIQFSFNKEGIEFNSASPIGIYFRKTKKFIKMEAQGEVCFSILFLKVATKSLFDNTLKLSLKTDNPIKIESNSSIVDITLYIAPRVGDANWDDDDDDDEEDEDEDEDEDEF